MSQVCPGLSAIAFAAHKASQRTRRCRERRESVFALNGRLAFDSRVTRSNRCVHKALRRALITFLSREIHSLTSCCPGKIILQIPAMPLGLFQKTIG
jgi:hypothetical protein